METLYVPERRALMDALKQARRNAGLKQKALADRLDQYQSFISKYETGERYMDVIEFVLISRAIGVDPCEVLRAVDWLKAPGE